MKTIASLFSYKRWANAELLDRLQTVSPRQHPGEFHTAIRTLNHVCISDLIFRAHLDGEPHRFTATNSVETPDLPALRAAVEATDTWFEGHVAAIDETRLQETIAFRFTDGDAGSMSREEMLLHVITHGAYHRGNVGQLLEGIGVAPPRDLYTRFLHLEQPSRRSAWPRGGRPSHSVKAIRIETDDLTRPAIHALLEEHLRSMRALGPPESVHALDLEKLRRPGITFWSAWDADVLLGCGALKQLDDKHGEVKSMRTPEALRRTGAGRALLMHIVEVARSRGYERLSLETGSVAAFVPAHRLYESAGFVRTGPFGDYAPDANSVFMTLALSKG